MHAVLTNVEKASAAACAPNICLAALMLPLSAAEITSMCQRLAIPSDYKQLALLAQASQAQLTRLATAEEYLQLLKSLDAFRRPQRLQDVLAVYAALDIASDHCESLLAAYRAAAAITAKPFVAEGIQGAALSEKMDQARRHVIADLV